MQEETVERPFHMCLRFGRGFFGAAYGTTRAVFRLLLLAMLAGCASARRSVVPPSPDIALTRIESGQPGWILLEMVNTTDATVVLDRRLFHPVAMATMESVESIPIQTAFGTCCFSEAAVEKLALHQLVKDGLRDPRYALRLEAGYALHVRFPATAFVTADTFRNWATAKRASQRVDIPSFPDSLDVQLRFVYSPARFWRLAIDPAEMEARPDVVMQPHSTAPVHLTIGDLRLLWEKALASEGPVAKQELIYKISDADPDRLVRHRPRVKLAEETVAGDFQWLILLPPGKR